MKFLNEKYDIFEPKSWWKYDIYWLLKSSCFDHFGNGKCGLFSAKKLMEIWYLLITENFLFWSFHKWEIRSFLSQEVDAKMIFTGYWEVLILNFSVMKNTVFLSAEKLMERWYLLGLFEFSMIIQDLRSMVFPAVLPGRFFPWKYSQVHFI